MIKIPYQRLMMIGLVLSISIGCDQTTKRIAEKTLNDSLVHSWFFDTLRLQFVHNQGVFLGLGSQLSPFAKQCLFMALPLMVLLGAFLFVLFSRRLKTVPALLISLIIGGGSGNLIDRFLQGSVTDFINVGLGSLRTGIFNVADMAILTGAIGLLIFEYRHERKRLYSSSAP